MMDSAEKHLGATRGRLYLVPPAKMLPHPEEEMPADEEGMEARVKRMKCQVLSSKLKPETRVFRSSEEAWEMVVQNLSAVKFAMKKRGMLIRGHPYEEEFFALGMDAAYFAALTWDSGDSEKTFMTHLLEHMKRCWRPMMEMMALVQFPTQWSGSAKSYRKWKGENPDGGPQEYAKAKAISLKEARKHESDYHFQYASANPLDGHRAFNALSLEEAPEACREKGHLQQGDAEAVLWLGNPLDLREQLNRWDKARALSKLWKIMEKILNKDEWKVMRLRLKERKTLKQTGEVPIWIDGTKPVSRERIRQIEAKAILRLRSSSYVEELRESFLVLN